MSATLAKRYCDMRAEAMTARLAAEMGLPPDALGGLAVHSFMAAADDIMRASLTAEDWTDIRLTLAVLTRHFCSEGRQ